jgi:GTP cyclohydrolase II
MKSNMVNGLSVTQMTRARIPTAEGEFYLCLYNSNQDPKEHLALVLGDVANVDDVLVRIHSECLTGDTLGSLRCDCGVQLHEAMRLIAREKRGMIIYLRQEGRGIGLLNKLRAYNFQDIGYDTIDANLLLGHEADERDYTLAALILNDLRINSVRLLTNNPAKIEGLQQLGITVTARVPLQSPATAENAAYLMAKAQRMNHLLNIESLSAALADKNNGKKTL